MAFAKDANAEKLYVTVDETIPSAPVLAKVSDEEAAMFELVRNENPSYLKNDYVMLDDKGKVKTMSGKDTVAYYTYNIRYQVNNQDWYYLDNSALNLTQEQASIVPGATHAFIIKENKNGSVSIMDQIAYNAKAIEFKSATEKAGMSTAGAPYRMLTLPLLNCISHRMSTVQAWKLFRAMSQSALKTVVMYQWTKTVTLVSPSRRLLM